MYLPAESPMLRGRMPHVCSTEAGVTVSPFDFGTPLLSAALAKGVRQQRENRTLHTIIRYFMAGVLPSSGHGPEVLRPMQNNTSWSRCRCYGKDSITDILSEDTGGIAEGVWTLLFGCGAVTTGTGQA